MIRLYILICLYIVVVWFLSCLPLFCDPMDCSPPGFSVHARMPRQEYWSGLPFSSPGHLPDLELEPLSPALAGRFFSTEPPGKSIYVCIYMNTYMYICAFFFRFFSHIDYYEILSRVPCTIQWVLVGCLFYGDVYMLIPNSSLVPPPTFPL